MIEAKSAPGVPRPAWNNQVARRKATLAVEPAGRSVPSWISSSARATWQCSISRLTVNCVAAISLRFVSMMWRQMAMPRTEPTSGGE